MAHAMVVKTFGCVLNGIEGQAVEVEAVRFNARPEIHITGLPGHVVKESRDRIRACLRALGIETPSARLVVHLLPATQKKEGSQLDLPIAMAILAAEGVLPPDTIARCGFLGELRLNGEVVRIPRGLALIESLEQMARVERVYAPAANQWETDLLDSPKLKTVSSLQELMDRLTQRNPEPARRRPPTLKDPPPPPAPPLLDYVKGQASAKRALQIALAGRHHLLFVGTPGVGKSLLAQSAAALLPPLNTAELIELSKIHGSRIEHHDRPFRSPHHSISCSALLGGGSGEVRAGEVTLAHRGVLFLDEFPEFRRDAVEGLREPLQDGVVRLNRIGATVRYPAKFLLLAAMNPCACGYLLSQERPCHCAPEKVSQYRRRVSGPILDRIDMRVSLAGIERQDGISHEKFKDSVARVWRLQAARAARGEDAGALCARDEAWFERSSNEEGLSYRTRGKLRRLARTIADLDGKAEVGRAHLNEAWSLGCDNGVCTALA